MDNLTALTKEDELRKLAALSAEEAPTNDPREILPAAAVMSYGQAAVSRPDWWADELAKIHKAASDPRWRVRELGAFAMSMSTRSTKPQAR